jgi:hypothetical protein
MRPARKGFTAVAVMLATGVSGPTARQEQPSQRPCDSYRSPIESSAGTVPGR